MMRFDSISVDRMKPDASLYEKGIRLIKNLVPWDGDWRELESPIRWGATTPPAGSVSAGTFSDPNGLIWVGTRREAGPSARLYEYNPASPGFTSKTPGTDYAGAPARWRFAKFGASVIAAPENNNTGTALQLQVRSGAGNFANLVPGADRPAPKFIGVCKAYLVGAHNLAWGGAGATYAAADPYMVMWSSRNNATVFTPAVDRSGFITLKSALGEITGLVCFEEFFLVFQQFGVTRFTWVGGDQVWEQQTIGGPTFGLVNTLWADGIVLVERDAYYRSNRGFAVIRNGEAVNLLGEGESSQYFRTGTEFPVSPLFTLTGVLHHLSGNVVWTASRGDSYFQVVYNVATDRMSVLNGQDFPEIAMARQEAETTAPMSALVFIGMVSTDLEAWRLIRDDPRITQTATIATLRFRAATGERIALHSLRPLVLCDLLGGAYPEVSVAVDLIQDPAVGTAETKTVTSTSRDENGWWTSDKFPLTAGELAFTVTIPSLGESTEIREIPAVEIALDRSSVF